MSALATASRTQSLRRRTHARTRVAQVYPTGGKGELHRLTAEIEALEGILIRYRS